MISKHRRIVTHVYRADLFLYLYELSRNLIRLANLSLFKLAKRLRRFEGWFGCLAQRPAAVAPGTRTIPVSRATAQRLHKRVRLPYRNFFLAISCAILAALFYSILITSQSVGAEGETATVQIIGPLQPPGFSPALLTIHVNDYVVFINQSSPAATYAVAADDGSFTSPAIAPGKQWTVALNNTGEYEYHATSSPKRMLGEILVVANSISLLPTAAPEISATAIAIIEAGKTPPDNLAVPTPTPTSGARQTQQRLPLAGVWPVSLLVQVESGVILLCLVTGVFFLVRSFRRRLRKSKEVDTDTATELVQARASPRRGWLGWLKKKKKKDEDEDEDE